MFKIISSLLAGADRVSNGLEVQPFHLHVQGLPQGLY